MADQLSVLRIVPWGEAVLKRYPHEDPWAGKLQLSVLDSSICSAA
jgi:hypothetical protein